MNPEEILRNDGYILKNIQLDLFDAISSYLETNNISQSAFANKLKVSKSYVSQLLNGTFDHKLSKLVQLSLGMEKIPVIRFEDINQILADSIIRDEVPLSRIEYSEHEHEEELILPILEKLNILEQRHYATARRSVQV